MSATISKPYKLINGKHSRKKRNGKKLTLAQKLFFGSKKQRAAARASMKRKRTNSVKSHNPSRKYVRSKATGKVRRHKRKNVGSILTVFNPGEKKGKKTMAKSRRRNRAVSRRRRRNPHYVRRVKRGSYLYANPSRRRRRRRSNPGMRHRRVYARRRRSNPGRRHYRRRNPGMLSGSIGKVLGIIGGAAVTKIVTEQASNMVSMISSGIPSYIAGAVIAFLQGKVVGKLLKSPALGENMAIGGYTYVALKVLGDLVPSLSLPFGLNGMGLITSSNNFGAPYVPVPGSMTRFVTPGGVAGAIPPPVMTGVKGLGRTGMGQRRMGRLA